MSYIAFELFKDFNHVFPEQVIISIINKGLRNKGIYLHEIKKSSQENLRVLRIIEKVAKKSLEIKNDRKFSGL